MAVSPALFDFSLEYSGVGEAPDGSDEYLRIEFPKRHPGWEPRFGAVSSFDSVRKRYDYTYLITGDVLDSKSRADAEGKVGRLRDDIAREFKAFRPDIKTMLPKPLARVWRWHSDG